MAEKFVLLRVPNMRGVNLNVFDFDFDQTWMAFFMNADEKVYGRYGSRTPDSGKPVNSLKGLRYALSAALDAHRRAPRAKAEKGPPPRTVEQYPASRRFLAKACIHCHHVNEFRREARQAEGTWKLSEVWVYPLPENVGLTLEVDRGNRLRGVAPGSPAARAGLRKGDSLRTLNGLPVASLADVQYVLQRAPAAGKVGVTWERAGKTHQARLTLADGWRETDISWRWSLRGLDPAPPVHGDDLEPAEKKALGLAVKRLAFRQGPYVPRPAQQAGIRQNDIIIGVDNKKLEMTARRFGAYFRLNYKVGDCVTFNLLRKGKRLDLTVELAGRAVAPAAAR
jgi:membrane-associated protease RseP (regulator of RpoE activity)